MKYKWISKFRSANKQVDLAFSGWKYAVLYDNQFLSDIYKKRTPKEHAYEPINLLLDEFSELERINKSSSLSLSQEKKADIAILGCGPVGMAFALWVKKNYSHLKIRIYEKRINLNTSQLKPFSRRWLTFIEFKILMPILRISDISLLKRIALKNYLGVDIRTLEYCLLRSLREQEIPISFFQGHIPEADVIIDATGGRFIQHDQSSKGIFNDVRFSNYHSVINKYGQKKCDFKRLKKFQIINFGNVIKPYYNSKPLQIPFMKINNLPPSLQIEFIDFANNTCNDFGIYYWNGKMKSIYNYSILFISLFQEEFLLIDDLLNSSMSLENAYDYLNGKNVLSKRLIIIFEWLITRQIKKNFSYVEPLFLWQPYLYPRKSTQCINHSEYLNVGDSYFIGNPKVANGLSFHFRELYDIFR